MSEEKKALCFLNILTFHSEACKKYYFTLQPVYHVHRIALQSAPQLPIPEDILLRTEVY